MRKGWFLSAHPVGQSEKTLYIPGYCPKISRGEVNGAKNSDDPEILLNGRILHSLVNLRQNLFL